MDGVIDPNDFKNGKGRTIKEIYDNSFVDYKKKVPKKVLTEINSEQFKTHNAASNLSFINPDIWVYDEEKPENGGIFENGLMASDPFISNSLGNSHATVN
jgi:hypothetical protein